MARIPSYGQIISGQCGFNQATSHPADPIKRHRARRERSHPKVVLTAQTNAVALDLLENGIRQFRKLAVSRRKLCREWTIDAAYSLRGCMRNSIFEG
jgi:hypothetical protein